MKRKFEEPDMTIVVFGSDDTVGVTSGNCCTGVNYTTTLFNGI